MPREANRKVNVFDLARRGGELGGELQTTDLARLAGELRAVVSSIDYRFSAAIDERGRPAATVTLAGKMQLTCDLCGDAIDWPLQVTRHYFFVASEAALHALPIDVAEEEGLLGSDEFDLTSLIEDDIILALPMAPRHPSCQTEHNAGSSIARPSLAEDSDRRKNPFAALATRSVGNKKPNEN
jgi:uncharacterized protein